MRAAKAAAKAALASCESAAVAAVDASVAAYNAVHYLPAPSAVPQEQLDLMSTFLPLFSLLQLHVMGVAHLLCRVVVFVSLTLGCSLIRVPVRQARPAEQTKKSMLVRTGMGFFLISTALVMCFAVGGVCDSPSGHNADSQSTKFALLCEAAFANTTFRYGSITGTHTHGVASDYGSTTETYMDGTATTLKEEDMAVAIIAGGDQARTRVSNDNILPVPTPAPTPAPNPTPSPALTPAPTSALTAAPTDAPTTNPTAAPIAAHAANPTAYPTDVPTNTPADDPTAAPKDDPTAAPTDDPTAASTDDPTAAPTDDPTAAPTDDPTAAPTDDPTAASTAVPIAGLDGPAGVMNVEDLAHDLHGCVDAGAMEAVLTGESVYFG
jgi:hypothetical protein